MPTSVVVADYDLPTRSMAGYLLRWIAPRLEPFTLYGMFARKLPFQATARQSDIIIASGHGKTDMFTGQNLNTILEVGQYNPKEIQGKVIKMLSCETGVSLGPDLISNGCDCFMGYTDDILWVVDADLAQVPWSDKMAEPCLMPMINGLNLLLDGATAREAYQKELDSFSEYAQNEDNELIKSLILFNQRNSILLGNGEARVKSRPKFTFPIPPPPLVWPIKEE